MASGSLAEAELIQKNIGSRRRMIFSIHQK
jgi:hypothetical protein